VAGVRPSYLACLFLILPEHARSLNFEQPPVSKLRMSVKRLSLRMVLVIRVVPLLNSCDVTHSSKILAKTMRLLGMVKICVDLKL
jgi:hypothetical protein